MQRPDHLLPLLLLLLVGVGGRLADGYVDAVPGGLPPESCDTSLLDNHIEILPDPVTAKDSASLSCAVVRSGVDSSLAAAATGDRTPCLCLLDYSLDFSSSGIGIDDLIPMIYVPCGGQRAQEALLLAARCQGIIEASRGRTAPAPAPAPSSPSKSRSRVQAISTTYQ